MTVCKANRTADPPQDCDAPYCGCNEAWSECIEMLVESGWQSPQEASEITDAKDAAYLERNKLVALLATLYPSGLKRTAIEGWSEDWHGCVYIDFPWGQASWHYHDSHAHLFEGLPPYAGVWDGHSTEQKYSGIEYATRLRIGLQKSQKNPFAPRGRGMLTPNETQAE